MRGYWEPGKSRWPNGRQKMVEETPLRSQPNKTRQSGRASKLTDSNLPKLFPRAPVNIESPDTPLTTAIASVIQVVVELPKSQLTQIFIPAASGVISLEGYEALTVTANPSPLLVSPTPANVAVASSSADAAKSAQASASSQVGLDPTNLGAPADSTPVAETVLPHPTSIKTKSPGHDSQVVLISSPLAPIPSPHASSVLADAAGSKFQTLPGISSPSLDIQTSPQSTTPPARKTGKIMGAVTSDSGVPSESLNLES